MRILRSTHPLNRWVWFAGLYSISVVTLAIVAYGLRALLTLFR